MKIAIDVSPLKNTNKFRGVGVYTHRLVEALGRADPRKLLIEVVEKGATATADVIHYPYFDLFFLTLPLIKSRPTVVTVHDTIPLVFPKHFPPGLKGRLKFQIQKFSLRSAGAVITDCQCSKKDIVKYLGFPEQKIFVVPLAAGREFKKLEISKACRFAIKQKYRLPDTFLLYVGDVNYHKNIPGLIRAFAKLKGDLGLVLVGKAFKESGLRETGELVQLIKSLDLRTKVVCPGFVPDTDLAVIYNLATVYCQPSFYEGFGLPVLEAMACGTPVVCAKTTGLEEIAVGAAVMVDPHDIAGIADGFREALKNGPSLAAKGLVRSKQFSWEKTAAKTLAIYRKIIGNVKDS